MGILSSITDIFNWGKGNAVEKLSIRDIDAEIIRFEEEENRLLKKIKKLDDEKATLFKAGSSKDGREEKLIYVRKVQAVDNQAKIHRQELASIQKNVKFLQNLRFLKSNEQRFEWRRVRPGAPFLVWIRDNWKSM